MSDYAPFQITIHDCPPEQRAAVLDIIGDDGYALVKEWTDAIGDELEIGTAYTADEARLDTHADIAAEIIEAAPGATFYCWTDPKYEYTGAGVAYAPDLGRFDFECSADGEPLFSARVATEALSLPDDERVRKLGIPWTDRVAKLRAEPAPA